MSIPRRKKEWLQLARSCCDALWRWTIACEAVLANQLPTLAPMGAVCAKVKVSALADSDGCNKGKGTTCTSTVSCPSLQFHVHSYYQTGWAGRTDRAASAPEERHLDGIQNLRLPVKKQRGRMQVEQTVRTSTTASDVFVGPLPSGLGGDCWRGSDVLAVGARTEGDTEDSAGAAAAGSEFRIACSA